MTWSDMSCAFLIGGNIKLLYIRSGCFLIVAGIHGKSAATQTFGQVLSILDNLQLKSADPRARGLFRADGLA